MHTALAVLWIGAIHLSGAPFPLWLSPIILGLLAGAPLSVLGSRASLGRAFQRAGLLLAPEEIEPPLVLMEARRHAERIGRREVGYVDAVLDAEVQQRVVAALPRRAPVRGAKAAARISRIGRAVARHPGLPESADALRLLSDGDALAELRERADRRDAFLQGTSAAKGPVERPQAVEALGPLLDDVAHPPLRS